MEIEGNVAPVSAPGIESAPQVGENQQSQQALPGETPTETAKRLYKVKYDGIEAEVDEEELLKGYAHNKAAAKRMEEASMKTKEAAEFMRMLRENPRHVMQQLQIDERQLAAIIFQEALDEQNLTPEEKELKKYRAMFEEQENTRRAAEEADKKARAQEETNRTIVEVQQQVIGALQKAGLPAGHEESFYRAVEYKRRYPDVDFDTIAGQVKKDYIADTRSLLGNEEFDLEQLEEMIPGFVKRIGKLQLAKVQKNTVPKSVNAPRADQTKGKQNPLGRSGKITTKEFFKR